MLTSNKLPVFICFKIMHRKLSSNNLEMLKRKLLRERENNRKRENIMQYAITINLHLNIHKCVYFMKMFLAKFLHKKKTHTHAHRKFHILLI